MSVSVVRRFAAAGLEQVARRGRRGRLVIGAIARRAVLVMAALAVCAITAAQVKHRTGTQAQPPVAADQPPPVEPGMILLTIPEIKRLLAALTTRSLPRRLIIHHPGPPVVNQRDVAQPLPASQITKPSAAPAAQPADRRTHLPGIQRRRLGSEALYQRITHATGILGRITISPLPEPDHPVIEPMTLHPLHLPAR